MPNNTSTLKHEQYCMAQPGHSEPRIETYNADKYDQTGTMRAGSVRVERCIECGSATYDGVQRV